MTLVKAAGAVLIALVKFEALLLQAEQANRVTGDAAAELRAAWEALKTEAESFVVACERGAFRLGALFFPLLPWLADAELVAAGT